MKQLPVVFPKHQHLQKWWSVEFIKAYGLFYSSQRFHFLALKWNDFLKGMHMEKNSFHSNPW